MSHHCYVSNVLIVKRNVFLLGLSHVDGYIMHHDLQFFGFFFFFFGKELT